MSYSILKIDKIHNLGNLTGRAIHNFALFPKARPNADATLTHLNRVLINNESYDYIELWRKRATEVMMAGGYCQPRKGQVVAYEAVLGFSSDNKSFEMTNEDLSKWTSDSIEFLKKEFGSENVLSAVLHLDEENPHIHAIIIPIDDRNHLCAKSLTGQRAQMFALQDKYAKVCEKYGIDRPVKYMKANKKELKQFYGAVKAIETEEPPVIIEGQDKDRYIEDVIRWAKTTKHKSLNDVRETQRELEREKARHKQVYVDNRQALFLMGILKKKYKGNKKHINELLEQLLVSIDNLDIATLENMVSDMVEKSKENENILAESPKAYKTIFKEY